MLGDILAELGAVHPRAVGHHFIDNFDYPERPTNCIKPHPIGDVRPHSSFCKTSVQSDCTAGKALRTDPPENEVAVGDGGLIASAPIAGRSGLRSRAMRSDDDTAHSIDTGNRSPAASALDQL